MLFPTDEPVAAGESNEIPINLQTGVLVLKWPEEALKSPTPSIAHLSIDTKGYHLICYDKFKREAECFDIALIHDTRTGSQVVLPPGVECLKQVGFGALDVPLTSKWLSIYYGNTFVVSNELRVLHFCFRSPTMARDWAELLFRCSHNPQLRNLSSLQCLEKIHSKILHTLADSKKKISVQNLIQFLCRNNRDTSKETAILEALEYIKLPSQSVIEVKEFTFEKFFRFYMHLMDRREIDKLFNTLGGKHRRHISWENLKVFLKKQNETPNDPFGIDYYERKTKDLIHKYTQHNEHFREKGMSEESFLQYLLSSDNLIFDPQILELYMDMNKPLAHYFIASSHNTYLAGSQLLGRASVEMYRQVLLTGCRCIELDVVDSDRNDEPEIKHIYTPVKPVRFLEVILTIREYAFKVTPYPLILSIENHCRARGQAKMAQYFVDVFGDNLLKAPLDTHPCEENYPLPSPHDLRYKILIKNKKLSLKPFAIDQNAAKTLQRPGTVSNTSSSGQSSSDLGRDSPTTLNLLSPELSPPPEEVVKGFGKRISQAQKTPREGVIFGDEFFSDDEPPDLTEFPTQIQQAKATGAMSDLVNYIVPVRFETFARANERNRSFEMSSFPEEKAQRLIAEQAKDFLIYNQRQLCRIYPHGFRFESSNYNPYLFWPIGCQMVALNYQTLDIYMQVNLALFSFNGACGYIEKPLALCQPQTSFDPRAPTRVENVVSYQIDIKVISGQFLCQSREPTFVDIQMYGMYGQINKRYEYRIRAKGWNGFRAIYDDSDVESGEFSIQSSRVILPEVAALRFSVTADDGTFVGQSFIPIAHLRPGYRHLSLRNQINIPVNSSSLFIFVRKNIYINAKDQEFADDLVEPLVAQCMKLNNATKQGGGSSSDTLLRRHHPLLNDSAEIFKEPDAVVFADQPDSYTRHFIAGSQFNDKKRLCKVLSLSDIHPDEVSRRDRTTHSKLRRVSAEFQSSIKKEEIRFQEHLNLHYASLHGMLRRNSSAREEQTTSRLKDLEQIEQSLLKLYSRKFQQQEDTGCKQLKEYYKKLEKEITDDYNRQLNEIQNILKKEKFDVEEYVRAQIKKDANDIARNEADRNTILILRQKSEEKNTRVGQMTSQTLDDMCEQAKKILQLNLQINLIQLDEERAKEIGLCLKKYADGFHKIKLQLHHQIRRDEHEISHNHPSPPHSPRTSCTTVLDASRYSSEVYTTNL